MKYMNSDVGSFVDSEAERKLIFYGPNDYMPSREEVDLVEAAFRDECDANPGLIRMVGIYTKQGRLALDVFAIGSEAALHSSVSRWSSLMYPGKSQVPVGHEWSIDSPKNIRSFVVE